MTKTTPLISSFKPSFPNPPVWTEELIVKRHEEFAAFLETPDGIAEDQAFDAAYSEYEARRDSCSVSSKATHG